MKRLGGTILGYPPAAAAATPATQAEIAYDDDDAKEEGEEGEEEEEEEDSPASTIVPSSPVRSRRNSSLENQDGVSGRRVGFGGDFDGSIGQGEDGYRGMKGNNNNIQRKEAKKNIQRPERAESAQIRLTSIQRHRQQQQEHQQEHQQEQQQEQSNRAKSSKRSGKSTLRRRNKSKSKNTSGLSTPSLQLQFEQRPSLDQHSESTHSPASTTSTTTSPTVTSSKLHPRVAVILGVDRKWYLPLVICRALSVGPALWWGLRCAFTFLAELLRIRSGNMWREGWVAIVVSSAAAAADWDVERRFRVTEVALAIMWCCASAYLSYFFMDCMMSRWLLNYSPPAVLIRLLATNGLIAYLTSSVLWLSGASSDPRLLLPAFICITTTLTFLYHATQNHAMIKRETTASISVLSVASYVSMSLILLQLHLTRDNEPEVPAFVMGQKVLEWFGLTSSSSSFTCTSSGVSS